jgi:hypothetical protein
MWATGPSSRRVTRCPASGSPALTMRSPRLTLPEAFTVRSASVTSPDAGRGFPNRPVNCLPLNVGQDFEGDSVLRHRGGERQADRPGRRPHDHGGDDAEPEWSSIPVMTLHSRPSARNRLAVTSICHSSIAAERSQRR